MARARRTPKFQFDNAEDRLPGKIKTALGKTSFSLVACPFYGLCDSDPRAIQANK